MTYVAPILGQPNFEKIASSTDELGIVTTYSYDGNGNILQTVADAGDASHLNATTSYTALGQQASVTDPTGKVTQKSYDSFGQLVQMIDEVIPGDRTVC